MSKEALVIVLGILLVVTPFAGLPEVMRTTAIVLLGVGVLLAGTALKSQARKRKEHETSNEVNTHATEVLQGE